MKRVKRLFAAALALVLLAGCGAQRTEPLPYPEPAASEPGKTVAYVPLDDRPDNVERVVYLAESVGYALAMPDRDLYRTALDGQPLNENGTQHGDMGRLYNWVLEQEEAGCDRYILSLDQLLSGGLVASRSASGYDVELSGGGTAQVYSLLEELMTALSADKNNRVWLLDSVMRLANVTVGYEGARLEHYNWLRAFGAQPRETLAEEHLTIKNVLETYWRGPNGEDPYDGAARQMDAVSADDYYQPSRFIGQFIESRERKLRLSDEVQRILAQPGYENFRLLIGIDDSSLEDCIQKNEIAFLRRGLRTEEGEGGKQIDWLLSGVDDLAFKAVARLYLDETGWTGGRACVQYFGGTEDRPACEYDFQPLTEIMAEHLDFFDLRESDGADLQILVLTQPQDPGQMDAYRKQLIGALRDCRKARRPTILIDASNGAFGTAVYEALTKETELGYLIAYSGMLDMAIVTGTALSHGAARYAVLRSGDSTDAMDRAWARTLADSILKDFCYKGVVRNDLLAYIRNGLGGDPNNFWSPALDREDLLARLEEGMKKETAKVLRNLEQSSFLSSTSPDAAIEERHWGGVALENYRFPWDRAFEIGMDIRLGAFID
nr:DUF4127 family protein [uncultured Oscillibacter sp.]